MIKTSKRAAIRRERRLQMSTTPQINESHPEGNRFTRRKIAKIFRSRKVKKPAYKTSGIVPWWLIPKKVAEEVNA